MEARLDGVAPAACGRLCVCASVANLVRLKFLPADRLGPAGALLRWARRDQSRGYRLCPCGGRRPRVSALSRRHWFFGVALARPPGVVLSAVPVAFGVRFALRAVTRRVLGNGTEFVEDRGQVRDAFGVPHDVGVRL